MRGILIAFNLFALATACQAGPKPNPKVAFDTTQGKIVLELFADKAPISTDNMVGYVKKGHYDGTTFHRVIAGFMIQGGGYTKDMNEKPTSAPIKNEATNGLSNLRGTVAMARTSVVDSATSQFFINVVDNKRLDHKSTQAAEFGYAVIGKVIEGMEVVDKIRAVQTKTMPNGMGDVPAEPVVITKAELLK